MAGRRPDPRASREPPRASQSIEQRSKRSSEPPCSWAKALRVSRASHTVVQITPSPPQTANGAPTAYLAPPISRQQLPCTRVHIHTGSRGVTRRKNRDKLSRFHVFSRIFGGQQQRSARPGTPTRCAAAPLGTRHFTRAHYCPPLQANTSAPSIVPEHVVGSAAAPAQIAAFRPDGASGRVLISGEAPSHQAAYTRCVSARYAEKESKSFSAISWAARRGRAEKCASGRTQPYHCRAVSHECSRGHPPSSPATAQPVDAVAFVVARGRAGGRRTAKSQVARRRRPGRPPRENCGSPAPGHACGPGARAIRADSAGAFVPLCGARNRDMPVPAR